MLDLAISVGADSRNTAIIETNHGAELRAPGWPQDCDFQLVAFSMSGRNCEVVSPEDLAADIGMALLAIKEAKCFKGRKPNWFRRLERYSEWACPAHDVRIPR
jgi:hypothetical protein